MKEHKQQPNPVCLVSCCWGTCTKKVCMTCVQIALGDRDGGAICPALPSWFRIGASSLGPVSYVLVGRTRSTTQCASENKYRIKYRKTQNDEQKQRNSKFNRKGVHFIHGVCYHELRVRTPVHPDPNPAVRASPPREVVSSTKNRYHA